jgi:lysophospholipase L1-like esterase
LNRSTGTGFSRILSACLWGIFLGTAGLVGAELMCRALGNASFLGNSRYLSIPNAYGSSKGNVPLVSAVSLGVSVFTDRYGFRVPPRFRDRQPPGASALLVLGDSVAFGSGVEEDRTFAGLLRDSLPSTRIYNSAVIGYGTNDYRNVVAHFLPDHNEVRTICLVLCLNDVRQRKAPAPRSVEIAALTPKPRTLAATVDSFLRSNSELYVILRSELTDPQERYWQLAASAYAETDLEESLQPIAEIAEISRLLKTKFFVVIAPYEFQLRDNEEERTAPQRTLIDYFEKNQVSYVDALPVFRRVGLPSYELFLPGNPMHFSEAGHEVIHEIILATLNR